MTCVAANIARDEKQTASTRLQAVNTITRAISTVVGAKTALVEQKERELLWATRTLQKHALTPSSEPADTLSVQHAEDILLTHQPEPKLQETYGW